MVHQGIGPAPYGLDLAWYEPRGFMRGWEGLAWAFESTPRLLVVLAVPSALLAGGTFVASRSQLKRLIDDAQQAGLEAEIAAAPDHARRVLQAVWGRDPATWRAISP